MSVPYKTPFWITEPIGNNALSFERRTDPKLYVPAIVTGTFSDARVGEFVAFEDFDERGVLRSARWLSSFIRTEYRGVPVVLVDNHNHVLYFWYEARSQGIISDSATLIHIDQHSDLWNNEFSLDPEDSNDLEKVFSFTQECTNVGNYIVPAKNNGLIRDIWRIEGESDLQKYSECEVPDNAILNLDLDFFSPELEYIDFETKKNRIRFYANRAKFITIASSPFFIEQEYALQVLKELFDK